MNLWRRLWKYAALSLLLCATALLNRERINFNSTDSTAIKLMDKVEKSAISTSMVYVAQFKDKSHNYQLLTLPKSRCTSNTKLQITILSLAGNFDIRQSIRNTWANANNSEHLANNDIHIAFIISKPENEFLNNALQNEIEKYDDIIVTSLYESYELLILKVHAIMTYKQNYCEAADFQLKCDEDMAVDLDGLYRLLGNKKLAALDGVSGIVWKNSPPMRVKKHRWYVPPSLYSHKYFPLYCDGPIYLIGKNAIPKMLEEAKHFNQWIIEDVFWTGVVAQALKIKHYDWSRHLLRYVIELTPKRLICAKGIPLIVAVHNMKGPQMIEDGYNMLKRVECNRKQ